MGNLMFDPEIWFVICYQHLKVVNSNGQHPWIPGPALFHVQESHQIFRYFAQTLIEKEPKIKNTLFVGMDQKKAIKNGFVMEL